MNSPLHRMAVYICTLSVGWYTACCFLLQEQKRYYLWLRNLVKFGTWTFWLLLVRETGSWRSFLSLQLKMGGWETAKWQSSLCFMTNIKVTNMKNTAGKSATSSCNVPTSPPCPRCNGAMIVRRKWRAVFHRPSIHGTVHSATTGDITFTVGTYLGRGDISSGWK